MNIILIGTASKIGTFNESVPTDFTTHIFSHFEEVTQSILDQSDVIVNFDFDSHNESIENYEKLECPLIFLSAVFVELPSNNKLLQRGNIFGFNGMEGFVQLKSWEISNPYKNDYTLLRSFFEKIGKEVIWVKNKVGMVRPRILFQILKEADQTFINEIASKEDIDLAMQLGTNYPKGPFQWIAEISPDRISTFLQTMSKISNDSRYEPSELTE